MNPIGSLNRPGRATVEGRVRAVEIRPVEKNSVLAAEISDSTGNLTALFYGRSHIPGIICGARIRFRGPVGIRDGGPVMINPAYELLFPGMARTRRHRGRRRRRPARHLNSGDSLVLRHGHSGTVPGRLTRRAVSGDDGRTRA